MGSKSYIEQDVHFMRHIVKRVLGSDDKGCPPIDICQLLGNSDIVQRIPEGATSEDLHKMWLSSVDSAFDELRKRYNLPPLPAASILPRGQDTCSHKGLKNGFMKHILNFFGAHVGAPRPPPLPPASIFENSAIENSALNSIPLVCRIIGTVMFHLFVKC